MNQSEYFVYDKNKNQNMKRHWKRHRNYGTLSVFRSMPFFHINRKDEQVFHLWALNFLHCFAKCTDKSVCCGCCSWIARLMHWHILSQRKCHCNFFSSGFFFSPIYFGRALTPLNGSTLLHEQNMSHTWISLCQRKIGNFKMCLRRAKVVLS